MKRNLQKVFPFIFILFLIGTNHASGQVSDPMNMHMQVKTVQQPPPAKEPPVASPSPSPLPQIQDNKNEEIIKQEPKYTLYLEYFIFTEASYRKVEITDTKLTFTYFEDWQARCLNWKLASPCWKPEELNKKEWTLSDAEVQSLLSLVQQSNFMSLADTYGNAPEGQRYYPETLLVKSGADSEKRVVYQSFPNAEPAPAGFTVMRDKLFEIIRSKFSSTS